MARPNHIIRPLPASAEALRLKVLVILFIGGFLLVIARLFYWQIVQGERLAAAAAAQHWTTIELPTHRGLILANDQYPLVNNETIYHLYVDRSQTATPTAEIANRLLPLVASPEQLASESARLQNTLANISPNAIWVKLFSSVTKDKKLEIDKLKQDGLIFEPGSVRAYPEASRSAHILGFVGANTAGEPQGYFGLEGFYDRELTGRPGRLSQETDATGNPILFGKRLHEDSIQGRNLNTYLDRAVQYLVEQKLRLALEKYGAISGTVTIMDPRTGAIIAMAGIPSYDPHQFSDYVGELYPNPIISQSFEPGSTFKILVMAAAINEKLVDLTTICPCKGPAVVGAHSISTWDNKFHPNSTITDIIQHSDNVGMVFTSKLLGEEKMLQYINNYGFGKITGIDLQEEATPALRTEWREIDLATASFGQGIAVTPIQMVMAAGAIANKGVMMQPHIVKQLQENDQIIEIKPKEKGRIVTPEAATMMTNIMVNAVKSGEAKWAAPKGYRIAGKTGTAQIPVAGHYDAEKTIASFIGFAPADNPQFVMLVTLREPTSSPWGSETAAPLWFDIAKQLLLHWRIPPQ